MKKIYLIICFFIGIQFVFSQKIDSLQVDKQQFIIDSNLSYEYSKPKFFDMFKYVPHDLVHLGKYLVNKDNFGTVALTTYSTVAMIPFDEQLTNAAARLGKPINLDNEGTYLRIKGARILPSNIPAAIYFIGNGGTTLLISGGFYALGKINNDYRMLNTSSELVEVLMSVGIVTQTVKRITGRQSPVRAITDGNPSGNWTLFPNTLSYQQNTPNYDAMPSGHLATYIATLTVIATNYSEVKWIKPVGYSLGGLLAFQMVSSKVHWTSDYPLAVLFGYVVGKKIANRRINKIRKIKIGSSEVDYKTQFTFANINGYSTIGLHISF